MKFKIGQQVKVNLRNIEDEHFCIWSDMVRMDGTTVTITNARETKHGDRYEVEGSVRSWTEECFEEADKNFFDWEGFKSGKFAVCCDTEEKAREFLKECDSHGIKWSWSGKKASEYCAGATGYCCYHSEGKLEHCPKSFYADRGLPVIDYTSSKSIVKEVKRQAESGEYVKVINADRVPTTNNKPDYRNGDVIKIIKGGLQAQYAVGEGDNGRHRVLNKNEYVVLKGYTPEDKPLCEPTVKEVKRPAKVGEWIKVTTARGHGVKVGTIEKVTSLHGSGVYINNDVWGSGNLLFEDNYVVLENYQPEDKPKTPLSEYTDEEFITELKRRLEGK